MSATKPLTNLFNYICQDILIS